MKFAIMMIGVPCSGKSTWIKNTLADAEYALISSDSFIEEKAKEEGVLYADVFQKYVKEAIAAVNIDLAEAIAAGKNIVWDQTNVTAKIRRKKLAQIPDDYLKIAVWFTFPTAAQIASRPLKTVSQEIMDNMRMAFEPPQKSEGFDLILRGGV